MNTIDTEVNESILVRTANGAGIAVAGQVSVTIMSYVTSIILARSLGAESFGIYTLALATTTPFAILSAIGIDGGALRFVGWYKGKGDQSRLKGVLFFSTRIVLIIGILLGLAFAIGADRLAEVFGKPELAGVLRGMSLLIPLIPLQNLWSSSVQGYGAIRYRVIVESLVRPAVFLTCLFIFFRVGWQLNGAVIALLVSYVVAAGFGARFMYQIFAPVFSSAIPVVTEKKAWLLFSFPFLLSGFLDNLATNTNIFMLGYLASSVEVGLFSVAMRLSILVSMPLAAFNMVFAPIMAELHGKGEMQKLRETFKTVTKWSFSLTFPLTIVLAVLGKPLLSVFGSEYSNATMVLDIVILAQMAGTAAGPVGYALWMTGHSWIELTNLVLYWLVLAGLNLLLIPRFSVVGAALSTVIGSALLNVARIIELHFLHRIHPYSSGYWKSAVSGCLALLVGWVVYQTTLHFSAPGYISIPSFLCVYVLIYGGLLRYVVFDEVDRNVMRVVFRRLGLPWLLSKRH